MSLNIDSNVDIVKQKSEMADIDERAVFVLKDYGNNVNYRQEPTNSATNSNFNIHLQFPNGVSAILDRHLMIQQDVTITLNGTAAAGQFMHQSGFSAPQCFALTKGMRNMKLTLQNQGINIPIAELIDAMSRYHNFKELYPELLTPYVNDNAQQFSDLANTLNNVNGSVLDGTLSGWEPRGAFPCTVVSNDANQAVLNMTFREPIYISPMIYNLAKANGLAGINQIDLQVDYATSPGNLIWSYDEVGSGNTLTSIEVDYGTPVLLSRFIDASGDDLAKIMAPNSKFPYPFQYPDKHTTQLTQTVNPGVSINNFASNSIALKAIPNGVYIWVSPNYFNRVATDPQYYLSIEQVEVRFSSKQSLSECSKAQLFEICKKNGYRGSWADWSQEPSNVSLGTSSTNISKNGSVLYLKFGEDIQLNNNTYPSMVGTYNFQVNITFTNRRNSAVVNPLIYIYPVYEGVLTIQNQLVQSTLSGISFDDVAELEARGRGAYIGGQLMRYDDSRSMYGGAPVGGGSFFGDIGSFFKRKVFPFVKKVVESPVTKALLPFARQLIGLGYSEAEVNRILREMRKKKGGAGCKGGSKKKGYKKKAGALVKVRNPPSRMGGRMLNRDELLSRMIEY